MPCVALLDQDLAPNIEGTATVVGKLRNLITSPIDGSVPNENDTVYVKSGGGLTLTKPTGSTNLIQNVGQVGRVSTSADGNIVVAALLRTNDVPNLPTGRLFVGTAANTSLASDVVYVDDTNDRVGIGTTSPNTTLEVDGAISTTTSDYVQGSTGSRLILETPSSGNTHSYIQAQSSGGASNAEDLALQLYGGNVGIGTTSPGIYKLAVAGSTAIGGNVEVLDGLGGDRVLTLTANTGSFAIGDIDGLGNFAFISGDSSSISISTNQITTLHCDFNNRVGIGTDSPTQKLDIRDGELVFTSSSTNQNPSGRIRFNEFDDTQVSGAYIDYDGSTNAFSMFTNDTTNDYEFLRATRNSHLLLQLSGNNVGIGTTNPTQKLHVAGSGYFQNGNVFVGTTSNTMFNYISTFVILAGSGQTIALGGGPGNVNNNVLIGNGNLSVSGNVGIGTTNPTQKLEVAGNVLLKNGTTSYLYLNNTGNFLYGDSSGNTIIRSANNFRIQTKTGGGESVRVTPLGNVGIGTTTANVRLEIGGGSTLARVIPAINNQGYIGDSQHRWQAIYATNGTIQTSDIREKTEIKPTKLGLDFINDLNPVSYKWTEGERLDASKDERNHQGLIAQEVAETLEKHGVDKNKFGGLDIQKTNEYDDFHAMSYEQLIAPMIKAIQELKAEIEELKKQINK
jgi:hypothetical protein